MKFEYIVIGIFVFAIIYSGAKGVIQFNLYCEDVARSTSTLDEFYKSSGTDENNLNKFQREIYRKIMANEFSANDSPEFVSRGRKLAIQLRYVKFLCIAFVCVIAFFFRKAIFVPD